MDYVNPLIYELLVAGGGATVADQIAALDPANLCAAWLIDDALGSGVCKAFKPSASYDGTHTTVTLGETGVQGRTSGWYDGTNDYTNIQSAALASAFNGAEHTLMMLGKVHNAGIWTDSTDRVLFRLQADGNNFSVIARHSTNNRMVQYYKAGGTAKTIWVNTNPLAPTDWVLWTNTVSATGDTFKAYQNENQLGATQTGLGTWAGPLTVSLIGSLNTGPAQVWHGWAGYAFVWNTPQPQSFIQDVYNLTLG